jgi:hypothetical protein
MTPDRWERIEVLFDQALEQTPEQRGAWLREQCGGDDELCEEVEKLLAADARAAGLVEEAVGGAVRSLGTRSTRAGQRIGPYEILSEIGRGGMG